MALACDAALGLDLSPTELSVLARQGSGSAARSFFGGFAEMHAGTRTDGRDKAFAYARKAFDLDPEDSYNQVFFSVYLRGNGEAERAAELIRAAEFHPSMSYNYACYHALRGEKDLVLKHLKRHFYEYESCDAVRRFEMAEARMDGFFKPWYDDPGFKKVTELAAASPWLK